MLCNRIHVRGIRIWAFANVTPYLVELIGVSIFGEKGHYHDATGLQRTPGRSESSKCIIIMNKCAGVIAIVMKTAHRSVVVEKFLQWIM